MKAKPSIRRFAESIGIDPGIVVGQLCNMTVYAKTHNSLNSFPRIRYVSTLRPILDTEGHSFLPGPYSTLAPSVRQP